ncbi:MAG: hypothetical protein R3D89_00910 [Sphingomonadaceae bacterium]
MPMTALARHALIGLSLALLAGCGGESAPAAGESAAKGDVQGGTISDEMLPYDTVRSQPPLAKGSDDDEDDASGSDSGEAKPDAE